jgi:hypothetical protein
MAKAKLDNATYADLERLRAEFEMYKDGSSPVTHYHLYGEWFASVGGVQTEQVNMKGIQRHGTKFRVQKRINGQLQRWTFDTLDKGMWHWHDASFSRG